MGENISAEITTVLFDINVTDSDTNATTNDTHGIIHPPLPSLDLEIILSHYVEYRWSRYLGVYGYPILFGFGTLGNVLSLIVMTRPTMIGSSTCFYMAVLAVADTMVLFFGSLRRWYSYLSGNEAYIIDPVACRTFNFLTFWSFDFAAWILVAMTIERFIAIHFPFSVAKYATVQRAKRVAIFLAMLFVGINAHFLFTITVSEKGFCHSLEEYFYFNETVFPWIDAALYSFIPFLVLLVFNILIIIDGSKAVKRRRTLQASSVNNATSANMRSNWRLTAMLLSVSLTFLVASAPKAALIIIQPYQFDFTDGPVLNFHLLAKYTLTASVMNYLTYANHAINFLLYCISGQKFRIELKRLLCKLQKLLYNCLHRKQRLRVASIQMDNGNVQRRNSVTETEDMTRRQSVSESVELTPSLEHVTVVKPSVPECQPTLTVAFQSS